MKYLLVALALTVSGCATVVSEYNQGCRDGVGGIIVHASRSSDPLSFRKEAVENYCDKLDTARANEKVVRQPRERR